MRGRLHTLVEHPGMQAFIEEIRELKTLLLLLVRGETANAMATQQPAR